MKKTLIFFTFLLHFSFFSYGQCPDPSGQTLIAITETTAQINWTENGTATTWEIEIVLSGATPSGAGTIITDNPYTASNLVSGETYDFYIRSDCNNSSNGESNWVGPLTATTLSCIFSVDSNEVPEGCLEYCFYANGAQFGTFFDFNSGVLPVGWNSSPFTVGAPCITNMIDNSPYFWAGVTDSNNERQVTTNPLDVTLGGIIQFYMRYGSDDPDPGCETADLPEEGVNLQYSIDNGTTWVNINYWQPTDVLTDPLYAWTQYTETIPVAAQTNNTLFRWYQSDNSGAQFDNWGLDNVLVSANTNANFNWDFGDGNTSTSSSPCHSYSAEGSYTVTLTIDAPNCNNTVSTDIFIEDNIVPTAICQNTTISLDVNGAAVLTPAEINNGSFDNCAIQSITLSQTDFDCSDVGTNNITMTVTDIYGNVSSCDAVVTVSSSIIASGSIVAIPQTPTSAEIYWTPGGSETSWEIEIVLAGTTPTGVGVITSAIPYLATSLLENTDYEVYIQAISSSGCSEWEGPVPFDTSCFVQAVPYVETAETQILGNADDIDNCWNAQNTSFNWRANSFGTTSSGTGPNAAATGTNYFYTEATGANTGDVAILLSPFFDLTTSTNTFLHFNYHMYGASMGELHVDLFNGTTWINDVFLISGEQQTSNNANWIQQFIDISIYETVDNFQVRFRGVRGNDFTSDMAIDDITIESLTCPAPINFALANTTGTSVDLSWTETGSATQWEIEVVPSGTTPTGTGTLVSTNPYTVTGLLSSTLYDFYIRAFCGTGDQSLWVGPITYQTPCGVFAVPYVEPVETQITGSADAIEECWSASNNTNFQWEANSNGTTSSNTGPSSAANGINYFYTEATGANTGDVAELYSPLFDLTTSTNTFLHFNYHMYGADMGELHVDFNNGTTWINDVFVLTGQQHSSSNAAWIQEFIDISTYETVANFQVRFRGIRGNDFTSDMAIDDITIESIVTICNDISFDACPTDIIIPTDNGQCYAIPNYTIPNVIDNCDATNTAITLSQGLPPNGQFPIGTTTVEYTASNSAGTTIICSFDVTVTDPFTGLNIQASETIISNTVTLCNSNTVDFSTTGGNFDGSETYEWQLNGTSIPGEITNTLSSIAIAGNYTVVISLGTCSQSFMLTVSQFVAQAAFTFNNLECDGATTTITGTTGGLFTFDTAPTDGALLDTNTGTISNGTSGATYSVTYTTPLIGSCQESSTETVTLLNLDDAGFSFNNPNCDEATVSITGLSGGTFTFTNTPTNGALLDVNTGAISNGTSGETYSITYTTPAGTCQESSIETITLLNLDDASFSFNSPECNEATVSLTGISGGTFTFANTPTDGALLNANTGMISNGTSDQTYTVTYTTPSGSCQDSVTKSITLLSLDDASFYIDPDSISCYSANLIITGSTVGVFSFDPHPNDDAVINQTTGEVTDTTPNSTYTIVYTTNETCSNSEAITYTTPDNCIIPQGISPNNDTINDYFDVAWLKATNINIFNRYGTKVYEKANYRDEWNGVSNDNLELPVGTYFYVIELEDNKTITGWVYINR
ncbi:gliding motility-associated C-terminal domain-containing protein [Lacinutrix sp. Bg11-31]|uniref:T9SS type B sorting domain-containing protein n=1 Tax=Lacinutrix sp. Bg11-31 TaxID=2057808 RepID=UPI000C30D7B7|nr:gliding motility-associated C-terminal domain-containing protein [Lacinutrix sp. Bg11-31]AUC81372.1 hypothetical protein CW733_04170 [Lacinutrix sp. Bg11-31]